MISIIMPCYNSAKWLRATLRSVYAQTYAEWELVAIDDGSHDFTPAILKKAAKADSRIRVLRQRNAGVSVARNRAIEEARGEYLLFLDSDDLLPRRTLEVLLEALQGESADIAGGVVMEIDMDKGEENRYISGPSEGYKSVVIPGREAAMWSLYQRRVMASMSGKLYRRELFDGIEFPPGEIYEDLSVFYKVAMRAQRYVALSRVTYLYRQRPDSQIHTFNAGRLKVLDVTRRIQEQLADDPELLAAAHDRRLAAAFNMLGLLLNDESLPQARRTASIMQCRAIIKAFKHKSLIDPNVRLKNRLGALLATLLPQGLLERILKRQYRGG